MIWWWGDGSAPSWHADLPRGQLWRPGSGCWSGDLAFEEDARFRADARRYSSAFGVIPVHASGFWATIRGAAAIQRYVGWCAIGTGQRAPGYRTLWFQRNDRRSRYFNQRAVLADGARSCEANLSAWWPALASFLIPAWWSCGLRRNSSSALSPEVCWTDFAGLPIPPRSLPCCWRKIFIGTPSSLAILWGFTWHGVRLLDRPAAPQHSVGRYPSPGPLQSAEGSSGFTWMSTTSVAARFRHRVAAELRKAVRGLPLSPCRVWLRNLVRPGDDPLARSCR